MIVLAQAQGLRVALPGGVNLAHQDHGTPREAGGPRRGEAVGAAVRQPFPLVAVPIFFWNTGNLKLKQSHLNAKAGKWGLQQGLKQSCRPGTPKAGSPPPFFCPSRPFTRGGKWLPSGASLHHGLWLP